MEEIPHSPPVTQPVNQPEPQHSNKMLFLILGAIMVLFIGMCIGYFAAGNNKQEKSSISPTKTAAISPSPTPQEQTEHRVKNTIFTFPYPASWGTASLENFGNKDFGTAWAELNGETFVDFSKNTQANEQWDVAMITKTSDYKQTRYETDFARLNNIFTSKRIDTNDPLWLPPSNAAITHYSDIQYVENKDASLRGIYYFARIEQNLQDPQLDTLIVLLTDGKGNIIQFEHSYREAKYPGIYDKNFGLCNHGTEKINCQINSGVYDSYEASYKEIIANISLSHE